MRSGLVLASVGALACFGCASPPATDHFDPAEPVQREPRPAMRFVLDSCPRSMVIDAGGRVEEAEGLLVRWVEVAGGVISSTPGVREARWGAKSGVRPPRVLRWRSSESSIAVQSASEDSPTGNWCMEAIASLEFVMEAAGLGIEKGLSSGCMLTYDPSPSGVSLAEAIADEMASRGYVRMKEKVGLDCWGTVCFGKEESPEWHVEWVMFKAAGGLEVSHVSVPFDSAGEREVMTSILWRLGLRP